MKSFVYTIITIFIFSVPISAQNKAPQTSPVKTKSANESCDGALDIAPTKSMTFMRKRNQVKKEKIDAKMQRSKDTKNF